MSKCSAKSEMHIGDWGRGLGVRFEKFGLKNEIKHENRGPRVPLKIIYPNPTSPCPPGFPTPELSLSVFSLFLHLADKFCFDQINTGESYFRVCSTNCNLNFCEFFKSQ
jgi:hypothetical protein